MIRYAYFLAVCLSALSASAQTVITLPTDASGKVQYQQVVKLDSVQTSKEILARAKTWVAKAYNSANTVVQQYDPEQGVMVIRGMSDQPITSTYRLLGKEQSTTTKISISYVLTVESKQGRYRATIDQLVAEAPATAYSPAVKTEIPAKAKTPEEFFETMKAGPGGDKMKSRMADSASATQESLLQGVNKHCLGLLIYLETMMKKPVTAEKDW